MSPANAHHGRYVLTGAAGFIGSSLTDRLLASGHEVVGVDSFDGAYDAGLKRRNLSGAVESPGFTLIEGDVRSPGRFARSFEGGQVDAVVHLAARAGVARSVEEPLVCEEVNVGGTLSVLEAARKRQVPVLLVSSSSVYGEPEGEASSEEHPPRPLSPYAASKRAAELFAAAYSRLFGLSVCVARLFSVYGPRQRPDMAVHLFAESLLSGRKVSLFGEGRLSRDLTYIDDATDGLLACLRRLEERQGAFEVYNIGSGRSVEVREVLRLLERLLDRRALFRVSPSRPFEPSRTCADLSRSRSVLGYAPRITLEEGLRRFVLQGEGS